MYIVVLRYRTLGQSCHHCIPIIGDIHQISAKISGEGYEWHENQWYDSLTESKNGHFFGEIFIRKHDIWSGEHVAQR
jgi:hypothetical protein